MPLASSCRFYWELGRFKTVFSPCFKDFLTPSLTGLKCHFQKCLFNLVLFKKILLLLVHFRPENNSYRIRHIFA